MNLSTIKQKLMQQASALPRRYGICKTDFYKRRSYLIELGYNLEPVKQGQKRLYSDEQVQIFDKLDAHIQTTKGMEEFPPARVEVINISDQSVEKASLNSSNSELVYQQSELIEIESATNNELIVDINPLDDIKEQNLRSIDVAAQYAAAQNLVAFNYLQLDYMKHRDFTVDGLSEEVHKSEQAVRKTFNNMTESPEMATKKLMQKLKHIRNHS